MNAVFTGFDEHYWHLWGMSWLASLQKVAQFKGDIFVVGFNLSEITVQKLISVGVYVINSSFENDFRSNTLLEMSKHVKNKEGIYAYWDADVYFQDSIDSIFELAKDSLVISLNTNLGFVAGPSKEWQIFEKAKYLKNTFNDNRDLLTVVLFYFEELFGRVEDTYNFTNIGNLKDLNGKLFFKDEIQKVIHVSGFIKECLNNKNILFQERYKEYNSLFKKKAFKFISAVQHNQEESSTIEPVS